ncbi:MAG: hypothetical protein Q4C55_05475 [Eubacterium sp.]|nr:hypothetical protein [Eubacterium sp.]
MGQGDNFRKQEELPAFQQLRYLMVLERLDGKRGSIAKICKICGVHQGSVSRYLKICAEKGYLTQDYQFTEKGRRWLGAYKKLMIDTEAYLKRIGAEEKRIPELVKNMIETIDLYTLSRMVKGPGDSQPQRPREQAKTGGPLKRVLDYGTYAVQFQIFRIQADKENRVQVSMANRGFVHPATLKYSKRGGYLLLTTREMQATSQLGGPPMTRRLETLKYEKDGIIHGAEIKDGRVKIPLEVLRFYQKRNGGLQGILKITVTSTAGRVHMPESTAYLVFWM